MLIFRFIFSILFAPIRILGNLFHHRDNLLEWHLTHDQYLVLIQRKYKEEKNNDYLLIASYILFLSRYFYICDDRQIDVVRKILQEQVRGQGENINNITEKIYIAIFHTLKPEEQKVVGKLYSGGTPPLKYSEDWLPMNPNTKYSFLVFENKGILNENLHLSHGPDIILLPITVGILYEYVSDSFVDVGNRKILDKTIKDLLEAHNQFDCRSLKVFKELPLEILSGNNIRYSSSYAETAIAQTAEEYFDKGVEKSVEGDWKGAIQDYNKAIELNPNYTSAYNNRGSVKSSLGDYRGAIQDFNKSIELKPNYALAYFNRGIAKSNLDEHKGAIQDYNKAIELEPNDADAYSNRGNSKGCLDDYRGAIKDFNKAIEHNPNDGMAYNNRGLAKIYLGQKDSGCLDLSKARDLGDPKAHDLIKKYCE